jgi:hypothetical protein
MQRTNATGGWRRKTKVENEVFVSFSKYVEAENDFESWKSVRKKKRVSISALFSWK